MKIDCPKCRWEPEPASLWACTCGHEWNTFDTQGQCPECRKVWRDTQCLVCHTWSRHHDWYHDLPPVDLDVISETQPALSTSSARIRIVLTCAAMLFAWTAATDTFGQVPERPNILWISVEDMSPRLGAYGDAAARTPNIDRLAGEGVRFTRAFTTAGVCAPSRAAVITGMYQNAIGAHHMRTRTHDVPGLVAPYEAVPPHYVKAFPEYLRAAGYFTTNNVKTDYQFGEPFTIWDEHSRTAHWRSPKRAAGQPFFAVFNLTVTHESQAWLNPDDDLTTDPARLTVPPYWPDTPLVRRQLAKHYDNIARMDTQVGEILQQLEEDGLAENTIVFFWSDHGDGLPRSKRWLYDSGLRAALVVRWPGVIQPGRADDQLVSFVDLAPTVLSLAGVPIPVHMQGRAFLGEDVEEPREYVFAARDRFDESYDMVRAVRDERYKYIRNYYPQIPYVLHIPYRNRGQIMQELLRLHGLGGLDEVQQIWMADDRPPEELYDTESDPHEVRNLAGDPAYGPVLKRMRRTLNGWMDEIDDMGRIDEAVMVQAMWPGGVQPQTAAPVLIPRSSTSAQPVTDTTLTAPTDVVLYTPTQGASIAYTTDQGEDPHWRIYGGPIRIRAPGTVRIRAKAIRYGYQESEETVGVFRLASPPIGQP